PDSSASASFSARFPSAAGRDPPRSPARRRSLSVRASSSSASSIAFSRADLDPSLPRSATTPLRSVGTARQDAIGGAQERREPQVDQIDARDAERHVAVGHHALVEELVEDVEDGRLGRQNPIGGGERLACHHGASTNEYGGHGPLRVTEYPSGASARACF